MQTAKKEGEAGGKTTGPASRTPTLRVVEDRNADYWKRRFANCKPEELGPLLGEAAVPGNLAAIDALYGLALRNDLPDAVLERAAKTLGVIASEPQEKLKRAACFFAKNINMPEGATAARSITRMIDREKMDCGEVADLLTEALERFPQNASEGAAVGHLMEMRQLAYSILDQLDRKEDARAARLEHIIEKLQRYEDPRDEEYGTAARELIAALEGKN